MGLPAMSARHLLFAVVLLVGACSEASRFPPLKIRVGQVLPVLTLKDLQGQPVTLATNNGKLLIINLWATWCAPCRHELPSLDRLAKMLDPRQARVIGVSVDMDDHVLREYLIERGLAFANYRDAERRVADGIIGIHVYPTTLFVGPDGTLLKVVQGWREWDTPEMAAEVRALLRESAAKGQ